MLLASPAQLSRRAPPRTVSQSAAGGVIRTILLLFRRRRLRSSESRNCTKPAVGACTERVDSGRAIRGRLRRRWCVYRRRGSARYHLFRAKCAGRGRRSESASSGRTECAGHGRSTAATMLSTNRASRDRRGRCPRPCPPAPHRHAGNERGRVLAATLTVGHEPLSRAAPANTNAGSSSSTSCTNAVHRVRCCC